MKNLQFQFSSKLGWFQFHTKNGTQCPVLEKKVILTPVPVLEIRPNFR